MISRASPRRIFRKGPTRLKRRKESFKKRYIHFTRWIDSLEQAPTITALRQRLEDIRQRELERSLGGSLRDLSEKQREALEDMTTAMMNKILHAPMSHLKLNSKDEDEKTLYIAALKKLFDLER